MRAVQARTIPIDQYLALEGHQPKRARGHELWYCSPIRAGDDSPSFKVDTKLNLWFDHGIVQGRFPAFGGVKVVLSSLK